jgi:hypothetical protein
LICAYMARCTLHRHESWNIPGSGLAGEVRGNGESTRPRPTGQSRPRSPLPHLHLEVRRAHHLRVLKV